jgi:hypothetical protein
MRRSRNGRGPRKRPSRRGAWLSEMEAIAALVRKAQAEEGAPMTETKPKHRHATKLEVDAIKERLSEILRPVPARGNPNPLFKYVKPFTDGAVAKELKVPKGAVMSVRRLYFGDNYRRKAKQQPAALVPALIEPEPIVTLADVTRAILQLRLQLTKLENRQDVSEDGIHHMSNSIGRAQTQVESVAAKLDRAITGKLFP